MFPYAGYVDRESTLAIGVHHDGHVEATERTFCSLYHTFKSRSYANFFVSFFARKWKTQVAQRTGVVVSAARSPRSARQVFAAV